MKTEGLSLLGALTRKDGFRIKAFGRIWTVRTSYTKEVPRRCAFAGDYCVIECTPTSHWITRENLPLREGTAWIRYHGKTIGRINIDGVYERYHCPNKAAYTALVEAYKR